LLQSVPPSRTLFAPPAEGLLTLIGTDTGRCESQTQDQGRTLAKRFQGVFDHTRAPLIKRAEPHGADHCAARLCGLSVI